MLNWCYSLFCQNETGRTRFSSVRCIKNVQFPSKLQLDKLEWWRKKFLRGFELGFVVQTVITLYLQSILRSLKCKWNHKFEKSMGTICKWRKILTDFPDAQLDPFFIFVSHLMTAVLPPESFRGILFDLCIVFSLAFLFFSFFFSFFFFFLSLFYSTFFSLFTSSHLWTSVKRG